MAARRSATTSAAVLPARRSVPDVLRFAPTGRSLLAGLVLLTLACGAYIGALKTSVFAVRTLDVRGGTPSIRAHVRAALAEERGVSLLRVDGSAIGTRLAGISDVLSFRYDRVFPHTLRVVVRRERSVLVLRQGADAYLVSATARVLRPLARPRLSSLPRLWVPRDVRVSVGSSLPEDEAAAATAIAAARGAGMGGLHEVREEKGSLAVELGGGLELRLGQPDDLRLKLAIARRILRSTGAESAGAGYLDVSVPERPVLDAHSQVGG